MLTPLRSAVKRWTPPAGTGSPLQDILRVWPAIVGDDIALHSRPREILGNTLVISTRSSAWSQQLDFLGPRILAAIAEHARMDAIERLRFRVAPLDAKSVVPRPTLRVPRPTRGSSSGPRSSDEVQTPAEALRLFRDRVTLAQRAKREAGWKECENCGVLFARARATLCAPCAGAAWERRYARVSRLLFDAPWLGYDGTAQLIEGLTRHEYAQIRKRVLQGWWEFLIRAQRRNQVSADGRERLVASSYVLLKTGFEPEEITTVIVRNLLGNELHELLYGRPGAERR